jgi:bifunctional non-homologous end joining protein LigD
VADSSDNLKEYRGKRDFGKTGEPTGDLKQAGAQAKRAEKARFVVQMHDATRLHYDVRLEVEGVLKSWAVPQGPSTDPTVKRLAVETEDHPMGYLDYEGVIPKGEYGAGPVIVWDTGTYENIRAEKRKPYTMEEAYKEGLIEVRLDGEKLHGEYALVRTKFQGDQKNWLMVKMKDSFADPELDIVAEFPNSIKSGKTIEQINEEAGHKALHPALKLVPEEYLDLLKETEFPGWQEPMLATPADKPFNRADWIYEQKLDGQRCIIFRKGGQVQMVSRNKLLITDQYPELSAALKELGKGDFIVDGEIVAFDDGRPSFEQMQKRMHVTKPSKELIAETKVYLYLFDILYLDGYSTTKLPLVQRKEILKGVVEYKDPVRYTEHREGDGVKLFDEVCSQGLEGVIAKDGNSQYQHRRSNSWLKFKCVRSQEAVIGGWTDGTSGMRGFGSLLVGTYQDGKLLFAGGVGTGFSDKTHSQIGKMLDAIATDENPFEPDPWLPDEGVHWVKPELVAQVGYGEWTSQGKMRHPRFMGLRNDKDPSEVVREEAKTEAPPPMEGGAPKFASAVSKDVWRVVDGQRIKLSNLEKVLFPDGITKGQVIDYYEQVAPFMLPHVKDRPLNMERFPDGIQKKGFYHKEAPEYFPKYIELVEVDVSETETQMQPMANNAATLVYLAQMAALTLHHWMSRKQDLRKPDKIVFDLDPSTEEGWQVVIEGAHDLRVMLTEMGLPSFVMVTGSRGLHIGVPIKPEFDYNTVQLFTKVVCTTLEKRDPKFTTKFRKEKRKDRVFLDYLRNRYGHTSVAPYTIRAKPGAPVAVPISWEELKDPKLRPNQFNIVNVLERLKKQEDPWKEFDSFQTPLPSFDKIEKVLAEK